MKKVFSLLLLTSLLCFSCSVEPETKLVNPSVTGISIVQKPAKTAYSINTAVNFRQNLI